MGSVIHGVQRDRIGHSGHRNVRHTGIGPFSRINCAVQGRCRTGPSGTQEISGHVGRTGRFTGKVTFAFITELGFYHIIVGPAIYNGGIPDILPLDIGRNLGVWTAGRFAAVDIIAHQISRQVETSRAFFDTHFFGSGGICSLGFRNIRNVERFIANGRIPGQRNRTIIIIPGRNILRSGFKRLIRVAVIKEIQIISH